MNPLYINIGNHEDKLIEEIGEVLQALGKIKRFGLFSYHPDRPDSNNYIELLGELDDMVREATGMKTDLIAIAENLNSKGKNINIDIPVKKILMSRHNPEGHKLEELLQKLETELGEKNKRILFDVSDEAVAVERNNYKIIELLEQARILQEDSMSILSNMGPDTGPVGEPRIGVSE